MKKLITPLPSGGVPVNLEDVLNLQNVNHDAYKQLLYGVGYYYVLSGVEVQTQDTVLNTVTMSEGWVWMDDEIRFCPAYTGAYPYFIKSDIDVFTKKQLSDGTSKNVYVYKAAISVTARPASGQYIECLPAPKWVFKDMLVSNVYNALNQEISTRQAQNTALTYSQNSAVGAINLQIGKLTDLVNTKVTKKYERVDWTPLPLQGAWSLVQQSGFDPPMYMRTEDGFVHLRGWVVATNAGGGNLAYLGQGFQSLYEERQTLFETGLKYPIQFVSVYGSLYLNCAPTVPSTYRPQVCLSGIHFQAGT